ncbi:MULTISPECIES: hypothetical protein [unclassified Micromonospora]|uniref:hypothetical protein n=1 Tax=Micromonospora TaxID=1873 RepID=UPI00188DD038|nr:MULTISPECIES: hypothetical protein [unclassified Micromonospora]MBF5029227.1 hypothetical protein [Micromonospora sp. ANENR4]MCZ7475642.1 hypothetical protein [Micromonospora sp. WMMC273]WBC06249.1 hypothetical protein O7546_15160 [Micromonospora sp. WMMA1976]
MSEDALRRPPAADAQEQRQDETLVGPPDTVDAAVPEASEADLAEQGVLRAPSDRAGLGESVRDDLTAADAVEQNTEIPLPDEEHWA